MIYLFSNSKDGWLKEKGLFLFENPVYILKVYKNRVYLNNIHIKTKKPLKLAEKIIKKYKLYASGFISYDYNDFILSLKSPKKDDTGFPLIYIEFHKNYKKVSLPNPTTFSKVKSVFFTTSEEEFIDKVKRSKEYIESGDFYQVNLSHRIDVEGYFYKDGIFYNLINIQPTDYMMYIKNPHFF